jgi:hypothetical protein
VVRRIHLPDDHAERYRSVTSKVLTALGAHAAAVEALAAAEVHRDKVVAEAAANVAQAAESVRTALAGLADVAGAKLAAELTGTPLPRPRGRRGERVEESR